MAAVELGGKVGLQAACEALAVSRATLYRRRQDDEGAPEDRGGSHRALDATQRQQVLDVMHSKRFRDSSVREVYYTLLEEGTYIASVSTFYRILRAASGTRERRNVRVHPVYIKPTLHATGPNQVWTWDITKLPGPRRGVYYSLYVVIDIFSRMVVGWLLAEQESSVLAERLLSECFARHGMTAEQLTVHSDRGSPMTSRTVTQLLAELGVQKSLSRPRVSNDNPFSESQFKTLKYNPWMPRKFATLDDARTYCRFFFGWYNDEHHHHGITYLTPRQVHEGRQDEILAARQATLDQAYLRHPERFPHGPAGAGSLPEDVWINPAPTSIMVGKTPQKDEIIPFVGEQQEDGEQ